MPLHIALESSAPEEVVRLLIEAHPDAVKEKDMVSKEITFTNISCIVRKQTVGVQGLYAHRRSGV